MTNDIKISREQLERGFDYVDGKHIPTIKISLSPCHPDDNSAWVARNMLAERIRALLTAPVVERQEPVTVVSFAPAAGTAVMSDGTAMSSPDNINWTPKP